MTEERLSKHMGAKYKNVGQILSNIKNKQQIAVSSTIDPISICNKSEEVPRIKNIIF